MNPIQIARSSIRLFWLAIILRSAIAGAALAVDTDGDGIGDPADNCTLIANASQCDTDRDGYGNHCDGDFNESQTVNASDFVMYFRTRFSHGCGFRHEARTWIATAR